MAGNEITLFWPSTPLDNNKDSAPGKIAPPIVGKVTHNSIELYWGQNDEEEDSNGKQYYCVQEKEEEQSGSFGNVYNGFARSNIFQGLKCNASYQYRLRASNSYGSSPWSPVITVATTKIPASGQELHQCIARLEIEGVQKILEESETLVDSPDAYGMSPLMIAAQRGYTSVVTILLEHGADVNYCSSTGKTSMMLACFGGHPEVCEQLLEMGASLKAQDTGGSNVLHWAVDGDKTGCLRWLLDKGVKVDEEDSSGWSPLLRLASANGSVEAARILLDYGADCNKADRTGNTALMAAALNGNESLVKLLVESGANPVLTNEYGRTAMDFAVSFDRENVVSYLARVYREDHAGD